MELSKEDDSKRLRISEEEKYVISQLPDEILVHILSFLPIKDAIKTVLVKRFGNLWRCMRVLDFNECLFHQCCIDPEDPIDKENFLSIIHQVLPLQESSTLDKLRLRINFNAAFSRVEAYAEVPEFDMFRFEEGIIANSIELLLYWAINRKVKVLDLDFQGCCYVSPLECCILPDIVLKGECLTELWLSNCEIGSCGEVNLRLLKFMSLKEVVVSDKMMAIILQGCPMLESLSLSDCYSLKSLNCTNLRLKKLMLSLYESNEILTISFSDLVSLDMFGCINQVKLVNASSVFQSGLCFDDVFKFEQNEYVMVKNVFQKLSNCKIFTLCTCCILVSSVWKLTNVPCTSFKWESLVLKLFWSKWHHPGISLLLTNSPCLESLTMYICPRQEPDFEYEAENWLEAFDFNALNFWNSQEATFHRLKTVMIYGYITEPCVIEMVKFLLKNAIVLEKMVISAKESPANQKYIFFGSNKKDYFTVEGLLEYSRKQLFSCPRASTKAVIHFNSQ